MTIKLLDPRGRELASTTVVASGPNRLFLAGLEVNKQYRNQGYGYKLIEAVVDYATASGYALIDLNIEADNTVARWMYGRSGFKDALVGTNGVSRMRLRIREYMRRKGNYNKDEPIRVVIEQ